MIVINRTNETNNKVLKSKFFPDFKHPENKFPPRPFARVVPFIWFVGAFVTTTGRIEASP